MASPRLRRGTPSSIALVDRINAVLDIPQALMKVSDLLGLWKKVREKQRSLASDRSPPPGRTKRKPVGHSAPWPRSRLERYRAPNAMPSARALSQTGLSDGYQGGGRSRAGRWRRRSATEWARWLSHRLRERNRIVSNACTSRS